MRAVGAGKAGPILQNHSRSLSLCSFSSCHHRASSGFCKTSLISRFFSTAGGDPRSDLPEGSLTKLGYDHETDHRHGDEVIGGDQAVSRPVDQPGNHEGRGAAEHRGGDVVGDGQGAVPHLGVEEGGKQGGHRPLKAGGKDPSSTSPRSTHHAFPLPISRKEGMDNSTSPANPP